MRIYLIGGAVVLGLAAASNLMVVGAWMHDDDRFAHSFYDEDYDDHHYGDDHDDDHRNHHYESHLEEERQHQHTNMGARAEVRGPHRSDHRAEYGAGFHTDDRADYSEDRGQGARVYHWADGAQMNSWPQLNSYRRLLDIFDE